MVLFVVVVVDPGAVTKCLLVSLCYLAMKDMITLLRLVVVMVVETRKKAQALISILGLSCKLFFSVNYDNY
jgi:hypothetical protein